MAMSNFIQEGANKENLQTIDIRAVHTMFQQVLQDIKNIKQETSADLQGFRVKMKTEVEKDVNALLMSQEKEIKDLKDELRAVQRRASLAENVLMYNQAVTNDIIKKLDNIELNNTRRMAVLSGFPTSQKKYDCKKEVRDLLQKYLVKEEEVEIDDVYQIGAINPKPVVITFPSAV